MAQLHQLASLAAIQEGLAAPHPDVVVLSLDLLSDARNARRLLIDHEAAANCWRTVNLPQVDRFGTLATLLLKARPRLEALIRAIQKMDRASQDLDDVSVDFWNAFPMIHSGPGGLIANYARRSVGNYSHHGVQHIMGRLDAAHNETLNLIQGELALAQATQYPSRAQDLDTQRTQGALIRLRDSNRSVVRRIDRLQSLPPRWQLLLDHPSTGHALSPNDPELELITARYARLLDQLLARLQAGEANPVNIINVLLQEVNAELATPLLFNHGRFSGEVWNVQSLMDLDELTVLSRPHQGLLARDVNVRLTGLNVLLDVETMAARIDDGIRNRHWLVQGMGALARAQQINAHLIALPSLLNRLNDPDVIAFNGEVLSTAALEDISNRVETINTDLFAEWSVPGRGIDCIAVSELLNHVEKAVAMANEEDPELRAHLVSVDTIIGFTRREPITFHY